MQFSSRWRGELFTTWPVALLALGGLLLLIGTSLLTTARKAEDIHAELDQLHLRDREVERRLRRLRSDVHLSGIYIRDYLLDTNQEAAPEYRERLSQLRESHTRTIQQLRSLSPPEAAPQVERLESQLDGYWQAFEPLFDWTLVEKITRSARFLRLEVLPRREAVLNIALELEKLNDTNLAVQRNEVARRHDAFRQELDRQLWQSLLLGFVVALAAVVRLRTLERRSHAQRRRAEEAEQEMRSLSQQLVAAQEEERKKLTRELHDHVGQMLTALRLDIGRAQREPGVGTRAAQTLGECKQLVDTILNSVRDLVMGLRPSMLDDFGLAPALDWHVRDFRRRSGMQVQLELDGDLATLPDAHRTCVYRIVQEALTNCARHSQASSVSVSVRRDPHRLDLFIADDGVGFKPVRARGARGTGLLGIEERVRELGGMFGVRRPRGGGTELHVTLPLPSMREECELASAAGR